MAMKKTAVTIFFALGAIFSIGGFCLLNFLARPMLADAQASVNWPQSTGVIEESRVKVHRGDDSDSYSPHVLYHYDVQGETYRSDRIWLGPGYSSSSRTEHERVVQQYPVGKEVQVFYKPDDPFIATLVVGTTWGTYVMVYLGWGFFALGMIFLLIPALSLFIGTKQASAPSSIEEPFPDAK